MKRRLFLLLLVVARVAPGAATDDAFWAQLKEGGKIVLMRHAHTDPGAGDPPGFVLGDCSTQRNLSPQGRADAEEIGAAFRQHAIGVADVLSSRWCRCIETATIAFGKARPATMLDSMFNDRERSDEEKLLELYAFLGRRRPAAGNLVLVTHAQNIQSLTGLTLAPGEMVALEFSPPRTLTVLQRH